jgi:hypothetical protein
MALSRVQGAGRGQFEIPGAFRLSILLACLLWSNPAWKMAARDRWIGWTSESRARNLQLVVNNSRFLILPWVQVGLEERMMLEEFGSLSAH